MRRADRLLQIVQVLRRRRAPTTAERLAEELEVTPRTIYRDVAALQASRVPIEGQAGVGYVLRPGYDLPPLMFGAEELEAVALGARMVADRGDPDLARAAENVLAKVSAVLPDPLADQIWRAALMVPHRSAEAARFGEYLPSVRRGIREQRKLRIEYEDGSGAATARTVWPLGLYFFSHVTLVCAWCELRADFRTFRADRLRRCEILDERFDARRGALLRAFLARQEPSFGLESA
jgi:predicted DNA-binding transcriptional regulator YafY